MGRRVGLDEGGQRGEAGKGVEVDVLGSHVHAVAERDLAQQQRPG
jgi:hypothetical protein